MGQRWYKDLRNAREREKTAKKKLKEIKAQVVVVESAEGSARFKELKKIMTENVGAAHLPPAACPRT